MSDLRQAAQAALNALLLTRNATSEHCDAQWGAINALRAALAESAEPPPTNNNELLALIERLQTRYGLSFLGSERAMLHFARDWLFLTTPDTTPKAEPDDALEALRGVVAAWDASNDDYGQDIDRWADAMNRWADAMSRARAVIEGRTT